MVYAEHHCWFEMVALGCASSNQAKALEAAWLGYQTASDGGDQVGIRSSEIPYSRESYFH